MLQCGEGGQCGEDLIHSTGLQKSSSFLLFRASPTRRGSLFFARVHRYPGTVGSGLPRMRRQKIPGAVGRLQIQPMTSSTATALCTMVSRISSRCAPSKGSAEKAPRESEKTIGIIAASTVH